MRRLLLAVVGCFLPFLVHAVDPAFVTRQPGVETTATGLRWDLVAVQQYGAGVAGNVDVLYSGQGWTYRLPVPAGLQPGSYQLSVWFAGDDHYAVPTDRYALRIQSGDSSLDISGIEHGAPFGNHFDNWHVASIPVAYAGGNDLLLTLTNRSSASIDDWIALDYLTLAAAPVPEPASALLLAAGLVVLRRTRRRTA